MKTKVIIAGAILLLFIAHKKKQQQKKQEAETAKIDWEDELNLIRENLHDYLEKNLPYSNDKEIFDTVMALTAITQEDEIIDELPENE